MDIAELEAQEARLVMAGFDETMALELGAALVELALSENLPVVIDIRTPDRTLFHASLPGSAPLNDRWARRKSNVAFAFGAASLLVGRRLAAKGSNLEENGLAAADHAAHGGAVPIRVRGAGIVAVVTVSGLPQVEDHALVVRALGPLCEPAST